MVALFDHASHSGVTRRVARQASTATPAARGVTDLFKTRQMFIFGNTTMLKSRQCFLKMSINKILKNKKS